MIPVRVGATKNISVAGDDGGLYDSRYRFAELLLIKNAALDLGLVVFDEPAYITAVYTKNKVKSAHILYNKRLRSNEVEALLVNSGCANACTGPDGVRDLKELSEKLTSHLKAAEGKIMFASTGVIGRRLPTETMAKALPVAVKDLRKNGLTHFPGNHDD